MSTSSTHQQSGLSASPSSLAAICGRHRTRARILTVLGAALSALVGWVVAVKVLRVDLVVVLGGTEQRVGPIAVACTAVFAGLAGWGLLAILDRRTDRAKAVWTITAAAVLLLSLTGPLGAGAAQARTTLILLHLAVGAVLIVGLRASARSSMKTPEQMH